MKRYPAYWNLFWEMTRCEFKLRDQGTLLGFLWTLLYPGIMFFVLYQLFTKWIGRFVSDYPFYLIIGLIQWNYFAGATTNALTSLHRKANIIRNFMFPKEIVVFSAVAVMLWSYLLEIAVVLVILLFMVKASWSWWYFPLLVIGQTIWILGISMFLSHLTVEFRDAERIWGILMNAGFFLVPVFYPLELIDVSKRFWLLLNPVVHVMDGMRDCLLRGRMPPLAGGVTLILGGGVLFAYGLYWFRRRETKVADLLA